MKIELAYGKKTQAIDIPDENLVTVLHPTEININPLENMIVENAMDNPIGTPLLGDIVKAGEKIAVIICNGTRPTPINLIMPKLFATLAEAGIPNEDVTIVVTSFNRNEASNQVNLDYLNKHIRPYYTIVDCKDTNFIHLGYTKRGTPVDLAEAVVQADRRICIGNIEYNFFCGYSGGMRALMPGCSTLPAVKGLVANKVSTLNDRFEYDNNPVRWDMDEATSYCPIDYIVNVVQNGQHKVIHAVSGHYRLAHKNGCAFLDSMYRVDIEEEADIVIASLGGSPSDSNLYKVHNALENTRYAVKSDGIVIIVSECIDKVGDNELFEDWIFNAIKEDKNSAQVSRKMRSADIYIVSEIPDSMANDLLMKPFHSVEDALNHAKSVMGADSRITIIPNALTTLPQLKHIQ